MRKRITIDLTDEPAVFNRIVTSAKRQRRSAGAQLLFEVLDMIRDEPTTKRCKGRATKATA